MALMVSADTGYSRRIALLSTVLAALSVLWATGQAWGALPVSLAVPHPVSHTDAWVKVSDQVDVRLNIFLDDVLRYEGLLSGPGKVSTLPADRVAAAISAYSDRVVRQLQIYGRDGQPLSVSVISTPRWTPRDELVDLSANELMKLTWKLRFQPTTTDALSLLTFEHQFTHPDLPAPGELRLHVQHQPTGRRLDAVVPPERPHVLHLPQDRKAVTGRDLNVMQTRLLLNTGSLTIEFLAPASVVVSSESAARISVATARNQLSEWARNNVLAHANGRLLAASDVLVDFPDLSPESRSEDQETPVPDDQQIDWRTCLAGIQLRFPRPGTVRSFQVSVREWPVSFFEASVDLVSSQERSTQLIACTPDAEYVLQFEWQPVTGTLRPKASLPQQLVQSRPFVAGRVAAALLLVCGVLGFAGRRTVERSRWRMVASVCAMGLAVGYVGWFSVRYEADSAAVTRYLQTGLSQVYESLLWNDEVTVVESLSLLMQPDLVEQTYLAALASVRGDDRQPVTTIHSLKIADVQLRDAAEAGRLQCDCRWLVDVTVEHWGHAHDRQLMLTGQVALEETGEGWRISDFRPSQAKYTEN